MEHPDGLEFDMADVVDGVSLGADLFFDHSWRH